MQNLALATAEAGHFVFPVWPYSKVPALHGEQRCHPRRAECATGHSGWEQRATRDANQIRAWWSSRPMNIGIAAGKSGLHVLDLDPARGRTAPPEWAGAQHGRDVLAQLAARHDQPYPGETFTVATPSGGQHLYYRAPPEPLLRSTVARLGWRIDSRGTGGFVVAPGSARIPGRYTVLRDLPIAPLPQWLVPLLLPPPPPTLAVRAAGDLPQLADRRKEAYLSTVLGNVAAAEEGSRHITLVRAAYTLGRLVAGGDFTDAEVRAALVHAAAQMTGFPAAEAHRTINDGLKAGAGSSRSLTT